MSATYFESDYPILKNRLEEHFQRVKKSFLASGFRGTLVLGGGYGRGEGGVMRVDDNLEFSNDLDYFLFDDEPLNPRLLEWCREIEVIQSKELGIDVEIKTLRFDSIGDPSLSMMFADLVAGNVCVAGDRSFLESLRDQLDFSRIVPDEASRLLWNRGSGMFYAKCRMTQQIDMKFVIRNHAKLKLALGDSWLCLNGKYTSKCRQRAGALRHTELPKGIPQLKKWHDEGVDFKFNPYASGPTWADLEREAHELINAWGILYLVTEEKRLGSPFPNYTSYLSAPRLLNQGSTLKNGALALRDLLKRQGYLRPLGDYPRAGLMRALPCLLGLTQGGPADALKFLPTPPEDPTKAPSWEPIYLKWWTYYA